MDVPRSDADSIRMAELRREKVVVLRQQGTVERAEAARVCAPAAPVIFHSLCTSNW
jgi:hypothetical protein